MKECFKINKISNSSLQDAKYLSETVRKQLVVSGEPVCSLSCGITFMMDVVIKTTATIAAGL